MTTAYLKNAIEGPTIEKKINNFREKKMLTLKIN